MSAPVASELSEWKDRSFFLFSGTKIEWFSDILLSQYTNDWVDKGMAEWTKEQTYAYSNAHIPWPSLVDSVSLFSS